MTASTTKNKNRFVTKLLVAVFWLMVWQLIYLSVSQEILIVSPAAVVSTLIRLVQTTDFWLRIFHSVGRIMSGFLLALIFGIVLAIFTTKFSLINTLFSPILRIIKATPVASFIILALLWLNTGVSVFISFLMVLPLIWSNLAQGIQNTDTSLLEMAKAYGFSGFKKLRLIYLPSVMPYFVSACSVGLGFAWKSGIAAEVLGLPKNSIGVALNNAKIYLETADLFAWTVIIILLSMVLEAGFIKLLSYISNRLKGGRR